MPRVGEVLQDRAKAIAFHGAEPVTVKLREVTTRGLRATQGWVDQKHVDHLMSIAGLPPIHVVRFGRLYLIVEGHHRATLEILNQAPSMQAWVYTPVRRSEAKGKPSHA